MPFQPSDVDGQLRHAAALFKERFGRPPRFAAVAPGRVNLIGEHTDYNDGFVLPMAIERQTVVVAERAHADTPKRVRLASTSEDGPAEFVIDGSLRPGEPAWANYVKGVIAGWVERGCDPGGFDALIDTTLPVGGGLSSSAALEVSVATLLEAIRCKAISPLEKALLCQQAEHQFAHVPCGIMDQSISVMGRADHAMLMDCRSLETRMVPMADPAVTVLIANTNTKHELSGGEYAQRRRQCEEAAATLDAAALRDVTMQQLEATKGRLSDTVYRRAHHVIGEIGRTQQAAGAASKGDWPRFGELMYASHASLRDDFEVSTPELDLMVELAREKAGDGVLGSRMTGGGFGGCTVTLVRTQEAGKVAEHLFKRYKDKTGIEPAVFATRPANGTRVLEV